MLWHEAGPSSIESSDLVDQQSPPYKPHLGTPAIPFSLKWLQPKCSVFRYLGVRRKWGTPNGAVEDYRLCERADATAGCLQSHLGPG